MFLALLLTGLKCFLILKIHVPISNSHFYKLIYSVKGALSNKMSHLNFLNYQEKESKAQRDSQTYPDPQRIKCAYSFKSTVFYYGPCGDLGQNCKPNLYPDLFHCELLTMGR